MRDRDEFGAGGGGKKAAKSKGAKRAPKAAARPAGSGRSAASIRNEMRRLAGEMGRAKGAKRRQLRTQYDQLAAEGAALGRLLGGK